MAVVLRTCAVLLIVLSCMLSGINGATWITKPQDTNVTLGESVLLECKVDNRGTTAVTWTNIVNGNPIVISINDKVNSGDLRHTIVGQYNLNITKTVEADTGTYTCQVGSLRASALLNVFVAPGVPSIGVEPNIATHREGDVVNLQCISNGGNPTPTVQWYRNGALETSLIKDLGGRSVQATLTRTLNHGDHQAVYLCKVFNEVNEDAPREVQTKLNVQFKPQITFRPANPLIALQGAPSTLECVVTANPKETLVQWTKAGNLKGTNHNLTIGAVSKSDAGDYLCKATNTIGSGQAKMTMQVHYPPSVSLTNPVETFKEKSQVSIDCVIDANPKPISTEIVWYDLKTNKSLIIGRTLHFREINRINAGKYSCNVTNRLQPTGKNVSIGKGSAVLEILVQYPPGAGRIVNVGQVKTGETTTLTCSTHDPGVPPASFRWTLKDGSTISSNGTYQIKNTKLSDAGMYKCTPYNTVDKGPEAVIQLAVVEPPTFLRNLAQSQKANKGAVEYSLQCQARGLPAPDIVWFKDGVDITKDRSRFVNEVRQGDVGNGSKNITSILIFKGPARESGTKLMISDAGNYTCQAKSDISSILSWGILEVNYPPQMEQRRTKIGTDMNETIVMTCACNAEPRPSFEWFLGQTKLTSGNKISIAETNPQGGYAFVSQLTLSNVVQGDLGIYRCVAKNVLKQDNETEFNLTLKSVPEVPSALQIVSKTWESVQLKWVPGFDGGHPQTFVVKYGNIERQVTSTEYNVTGLYPLRMYTFQVLGQNSLGRGKFSDPETTTSDGITIPKPGDVKYSKKDNIVHYLASGTDYCVRVDISEDAMKWINYEECGPIQKTIKIKSDVTVNHVNLTLCLQHRPDVCGLPPVKAKILESEDTVPTETIIIVACVCGAVVLILLIILLVLCCRRQKQDKEFPEAAHRRPNPVPLTGSKRGRSHPTSGIDNPALDTLDGDMDDPTAGDKNMPTPRMNGGPPSLYAHQNGRLPSDPPPSYEMESFKDPFTITITHPEDYDTLEKKPVLQLNSDTSSDKPYSELYPNGSLKMDDSRSHNESGYSTPDPTKPKKNRFGFKSKKSSVYYADEGPFPHDPPGHMGGLPCCRDDFKADLMSGKFGWFKPTVVKENPLFVKSPKIPRRKSSKKKGKKAVRADSVRRADQPTEGKKSYPKSVLGGTKVLPESPPPRRAVQKHPSDRSTTTSSSSFEENNWYLRQDPMFGHHDRGLQDSDFRAGQEVAALQRDNSQLATLGGPLDFYRGQMGYDIPPEAFYGYGPYGMGYPLMPFAGPWSFYNQWMPPYSWPGMQDGETPMQEMYWPAQNSYHGRYPFLREAIPQQRQERQLPPHPMYLPEPTAPNDSTSRSSNDSTLRRQDSNRRDEPLRRQDSGKKSRSQSQSVSRSSSFDDVIDTEQIRQQEQQRLAERPRIPPSIPPKPTMQNTFMSMPMPDRPGGYIPQNDLVSELRRVMTQRQPQEPEARSGYQPGYQPDYPKPPWATPPRPSSYAPPIPPFPFGPLPSGPNQAFHFRDRSNDSHNSSFRGDNPVTLIL